MAGLYQRIWAAAHARRTSEAYKSGTKSEKDENSSDYKEQFQIYYAMDTDRILLRAETGFERIHQKAFALAEAIKSHSVYLISKSSDKRLPLGHKQVASSM